MPAILLPPTIETLQPVRAGARLLTVRSLLYRLAGALPLKCASYVIFVASL